eukprot:PhM_4_TR1159/c0_g2_i1/m.70742
MAFARWKNINIDALADSVNSDKLQKTHFGPEFSRQRHIIGLAITEVTSTTAAAADGPAGSSGNPKPRTTGSVAPMTPPEEIEKQSTPTTTTEQDATGNNIGTKTDGMRYEPAPPRPDSLWRRGGHLGTTSELDSEEPQIHSSTGKRDPKQWSPEEVTVWIRENAAKAGLDLSEVDEIIDAMDMIPVSGAILLELNPPNMFKEMRRSVRQPNRPTELTMDLLKETSLLCFQYGGSPHALWRS